MAMLIYHTESLSVSFTSTVLHEAAHLAWLVLSFSYPVTITLNAAMHKLKQFFHNNIKKVLCTHTRVKCHVGRFLQEHLK